MTPDTPVTSAAPPPLTQNGQRFVEARLSFAKAPYESPSQV